eukprot:scaffold12012_cov205-Skeletonema_dohrnii-CCMP3373.AAC.1
MLSATAILLACTSVVSSRSSSAIPERTKQQHNHPNNNSHAHNLPQHRIRRPERQVPYPKYHPLSRYLRVKEDDGNNHQNNIKLNDNKIEDEEQSQQPRRRQQQSRRRRRNINNYQDEEESIIEDKVVLDNTGELLHYWTVTGRNLITSSTSSSFTEGGVSGSGGAISTTNDEISDESAKLLMDVNELTSSNSTSSASGGEGSLSAGGDESDANDEAVEMSLPYNNDQATPQNPEFNSETTIKDTLESAVDTIIDTIEAAAAAESTTSTTTTEQTSIYQPIRLRAIFTDDQTSGFQYLTDTQRTILMEQIVNPALFAWSKALSVVPVGNGDYDGDENDMDDSLVVDKTQLYDGESCGPGLDSGYPSVRVPLEHMTDGIPETDTVIYISVSFKDPNLNSGGGGGDESDTLFTTSATLPSLNHLHRSAIIQHDDNEKKYINETEEELINDMESTDAPSSSQPSTSPSFPPSETEPNVDTRPICHGTYI